MTKQPPPISIRLTAEEHSKLRRAAESVGISGYIRQRLFGGNSRLRKHRTRMPSANEHSLGQILALLGRSGIAENLRALATDANDGALLLDEQTINQLNDACADVAEIRRLLILALGLKDPGAAHDY